MSACAWSKRLAGLSVALCLAAGILQSGAAKAEYPDRPIHISVGFPAGSGADVLSRYYAAKLQDLSGQPVIIDNRPGATGNISLRFVAHADPDGYNILFGPSSNMAGSRFLFKETPFDTLKDFLPVASFAQIAFVIIVAPNSPINTLQDLVAHLKSKQDTIFGYSNQTGQLTGELIKQKTGAPVKPVSYKAAADAMKDILDGTLDFMVLDGTFAAPFVRQGQIKAIAVTTANRSPSFPGVPTISESGLPGFEFAPWWTVYLPANTPKPIADKLEAWMHQINKMPETPKFLETVGSIVNDDTGANADKRLRAELPTWEALVKTAGIEPQ